MNKILTIVVPTYNVEKYLSRCLDSLLYDEKTNKKLEIIVVNDGSKDNSLKIANEYKEKYKDTVIVIDKENVLKGIVTFKDIKITNEKSRALSEIMSENPLRVNEDDSLVDILTVMNENSVGFIPVVNSEEKLVGLITRSSLLSILSDQFLDMEVNIFE